MSIHPPKVESFDTTAMTNTDPKGVLRDVEVYREHPHGLYMARPTPGRPQFHYLESWLLPELGLRVTDFHFTAGHERDQDFYLDVVDIERGELWRTTDLYLDIAVKTGSHTELLDVDELLDAHAAGLVDTATAERATRIAVDTLAGVRAHGHDLHSWLREYEITLTWRRQPSS